jgi:hypothetical protein
MRIFFIVLTLLMILPIGGKALAQSASRPVLIFPPLNEDSCVNGSAEYLMWYKYLDAGKKPDTGALGTTCVTAQSILTSAMPTCKNNQAAIWDSGTATWECKTATLTTTSVTAKPVSSGGDAITTLTCPTGGSLVSSIALCSQQWETWQGAFSWSWTWHYSSPSITCVLSADGTSCTADCPQAPRKYQTSTVQASGTCISVNWK